MFLTNGRCLAGGGKNQAEKIFFKQGPQAGLAFFI